MSGDTKRSQLREVLSWADAKPAIPEDSASALDVGPGGGRVGFNTYRWASLSYLIRFGLAWKRLAPLEREAALSDPWAFHAVAGRVETTGGGTFAHEALLHLVHPDTFDRIFSRGEKWNRTQRLAGLVQGNEPDVDRRIAQIRRNREERFGPDLRFLRHGRGDGPAASRGGPLADVSVLAPTISRRWIAR